MRSHRAGGATGGDAGDAEDDAVDAPGDFGEAVVGGGWEGGGGGAAADGGAAGVGTADARVGVAVGTVKPAPGAKCGVCRTSPSSPRPRGLSRCSLQIRRNVSFSHSATGLERRDACCYCTVLTVLTYTRVRARILVVARRRACGGSESKLFLHVVGTATCCLPMRPAELTESVSPPLFDVSRDAHHNACLAS